jgi:hypothetical protein
MWIEDLLQQWSGVDCVAMYRRNDGRRDCNETVLISAVGNIESRQRLQRLLLVDKLIDHLRMQTAPNIIVNHFL